ncbi:MAG TPA: TetR family transcriptional regulator [Streptosporangiaceae bacterium]|nr:TetR family transcriptional regulator [Streptosporangiaceae bacterium]
MTDGLRERKKARTRAAIREHAIRLFREQGYAATTVEQIAAAAEVSPSTFFRYFPTKEDVVLQDDLDTRLLEVLEQQPPGFTMIAAMRAAIHETIMGYSETDVALLAETTRMMRSVPEVRARALDEFARTITMIAGAIAKRSGRSPDDLAVRTTAGAVIGVIMSVTMPWEELADGTMPDIRHSLAQIDDALALLEGGLPLLCS